MSRFRDSELWLSSANFVALTTTSPSFHSFELLFEFDETLVGQHLKSRVEKLRKSPQNSDQSIRQGQQASSERNERRPVGPSEFSETASEMSERRA